MAAAIPSDLMPLRQRIPPHLERHPRHRLAGIIDKSQCVLARHGAPADAIKSGAHILSVEHPAQGMAALGLEEDALQGGRDVGVDGEDPGRR